MCIKCLDFSFYLSFGSHESHVHLCQSNQCTLHISRSDSIQKPDCCRHTFLFKSSFKTSSCCPHTWIPHLWDHHRSRPVLLPKSPFCHLVSICLLVLSDHPLQHIIQCLITCLRRPTTLCNVPVPPPPLFFQLLHPQQGAPAPVADCRGIVLSYSLQSPSHSFGFKLHLADLWASHWQMTLKWFGQL